MEGRILLQNLLRRGSLPLLAVPLLLGLLISRQYHSSGLESSSIYFTGFLGFFWCLMVTTVATLKRCGELELALPLSGRIIWKNHAAATVAVGLLNVALFVLPITITGTPWIRGQFLAIGGHLLAGLVLTCSLIHRVSPGRSELSPSGQTTGAAAAGIVIMVFLLVFRSPWLSLAAVAAAGVLMLLAFKRVPETLTLADDHSGPRGGYATLGRWEPAAAGRASAPVALKVPARTGRYLSTLWMLGKLNLHQFSTPARIIGFLILISLGGALITPDAGFAMLAISLFAVWVILGILSPELVNTGSPYAHLPIPRRRLHTAMLLPVLAVAGFGAGVQIAIDLFTDTYPGLIRIYELHVDEEPRYRISVPPMFYEIAWDGQPPAVVGSNGETHVPVVQDTALSVSKTDGIVIYNPYDFNDNPSLAFITEQYMRAVKTIYGVDLDRERAGQLLTRNGGRLESVDGLSLVNSPQRTAIGVILFSLVWMLLGFLFALFTRLVRPARLERWRRTLRTRAVSASAVVFVIIYVITKFPAYFTSGFAWYMPAITSHLARMMPGAFLSLTGALVCLVAAWLVSQELFARRQVLPGGAV